MRHVRFTLHTGPMYAGKTSALAQILCQAKQSDVRAALLRPVTDTRVQRALNFARPLYRIRPADDPGGRETARLLSTTGLIVLDEVQFIANWATDFLSAVKEETRLENVHVIAAGLDLKSDGTPWPGMVLLSERAHLHIRHTGTCAECGAPATMTLSMRPMPADGIAIGDVSYRPLCRACWEKHSATAALRPAKEIA